MAQALAHAPAPDLALGRYRPLRPLGSGASGSVWLARDEQTGLDVALKIVPREGKAGLRAEREAEAASRLRHPTCLRAYAFGRERGHVYIAYEYAPGCTFRDALRSKELGDADLIEACAQLSEGLAHAHGRGVVHRDVKPANVLLAERRRRLRPPARLRPRRLRGGRDPDRGRRRPRHARVHLARAPRRRAGDGRRRRLGRRRDALGGARRPAPVLAALADGDGARDRGGRSLAPHRAPGPAGVPAGRGRPGARHRPAQATDGREARRAPPRRATEARAEERKQQTVTCARAPRPRARCPASSPGSPRRCSRSGRPGSCFAFAALATVLGFLRPRLGLGAALAVGVLPVGNLSLGLAFAYAAAVVAWLAATAGPCAAAARALHRDRRRRPRGARPDRGRRRAEPARRGGGVRLVRRAGDVADRARPGPRRRHRSPSSARPGGRRSGAPGCWRRCSSRTRIWPRCP